MLFTITVETAFNAEHQLTLPDGSCEDLHEHCWKVRAAVSTRALDKMDVVMDFNLLKQHLDGILAPLTGVKLERVEYFVNEGINASAETVARYIYKELAPMLPDNVSLQFTEVMEQAGCWAKYSK